MSTKKPPVDPKIIAVRVLKMQERARAKLKLAQELDRLSPRDRKKELQLLKPLLVDIGNASGTAFQLLSYNSKEEPDGNVIHIFPWVAKRAVAIGDKQHRTLHSFLVDTKNLTDSMLAVIKANRGHLGNHPALLEHCKEAFNMVLQETGAIQLVNNLLKEIHGEGVAATAETLPPPPETDPDPGPSAA